VTPRIAYKPVPEDLELARLLLSLEERRATLRARESERSELELALTQFAGEVRLRIGDLKDQIRSYRTQLERIRQLTQRLKADPDAAPADVERRHAEEAVEDEEMEPPTGFQGRPGGGPGNGFYRPHNHEYGSSHRSVEVTRLYRLLAKRHHPDLATTAAERQRRTELMLRINIAYRDQNLTALQALMLEVHYDLPVPPAQLTRQRITWARHELAEIDQELRLLEKRIEALRSTETHALWQAETQGDGALDDLERRTKERLSRERTRFEEASSQYARMAARRQVMLRRATARMPMTMAHSD
jgi:archaellum component FlaC